MERLVRKLLEFKNRCGAGVSGGEARGCLGRCFPSAADGWCLAATPRRSPAVVFLNHYDWPMQINGTHGWEVANYAWNAENDYNVLAQFYGAPALSIRAAAFHLMVRNETGYKREHALLAGGRVAGAGGRQGEGLRGGSRQPAPEAAS